MTSAKRLVLVYPSGRPTQVCDAIRRARMSATYQVQVAVGLNGDRAGVPPIPDSVLIDFGRNMSLPGFISATNQTYRLAIDYFNVGPDELVGFWSDDFYPKEGWDAALHEALRKNPKQTFLCPDDTIARDACSVAPFATYSWWDGRNGKCMWPPIYKRFSCDDDNTHRAKLLGEFQFVPECVIVHHHPSAKMRVKDSLDTAGEAYYCDDEMLFKKVRRPQLNAGEKFVTW